MTWESNSDLIVSVALPSGYVTNPLNLWEITEATGSSVASVPGASSHQGENSAQVHKLMGKSLSSQWILDATLTGLAIS